MTGIIGISVATSCSRHSGAPSRRPLHARWRRLKSWHQDFQIEAEAWRGVRVAIPSVARNGAAETRASLHGHRMVSSGHHRPPTGAYPVPLVVVGGPRIVSPRSIGPGH